MTPEQINIAIAEHCGWKKRREVEPGHFIWTTPDGALAGQPCLPNYHGDLNAMHGAEKEPGGLWQDYLGMLWGVVNPSIKNEGRVHPQNSMNKMMVCATAAQRAEALLRTVGKWKEGA